MLRKAVDDILAEESRKGKTEEEAWETVSKNKLVLAMATYFLAAPGLISSTSHVDMHNKLQRGGYLQPAGHGGRFTWDGSENAITISPLWAKSYTWIDYVLWVEGSSRAPAYMDNRVIRLASNASFPELALSLTHSCNRRALIGDISAFVSDTLDWSAYRTTQDAIALQRAALVATNLCTLKKMPCRVSAGPGNMTDYQMLIERLRKSVSYTSGGVPTPRTDSELLGAGLFKYLRTFDSETKPGSTPTPIPDLLDPLLAPLLLEASDHYAVLSYVVFSSKTSGDAAFGTVSGSTSRSTSPWSSMGGEWGISPAPRTLKNALRIMTQNMHFRPYDIRPLPTVSACNANYMAMNMQEFRARVFVKALTELEAAEFPHVLCLQETQHDAANAILTEHMHAKFPGLNSVTGKTARRTLSGRDDSTKGSGIWSGLQIWTSWNILDSIFVRFSDTLFQAGTKGAARGAYVIARGIAESYGGGGLFDAAASALSRVWAAPTADPTTKRKTRREHIDAVASAGADKLAVNKGMLYALLQNPKNPGECIRVVVTHPSPYVQLPVPGLDTTPEQVARIHRGQINALGEFIRYLNEDDEQSGRPIFVTGDLNINKYAVKPDSADEKDVVLAQRGRSREFGNVLSKINAVAPAFVADVNTKRWVPVDKVAAALLVETELLGKPRKPAI